jgi:hypothetical protein
MLSLREVAGYTAMDNRPLNALHRDGDEHIIAII